ncbi:MAG: protein kinase [Acidobacteriota bacterium]|nr:protein kinase [Acidobacteriota bacterium]
MIGARIGHLLVTGALGSGGMGEVYRAYDERLNRTVALKVIRADRRLSADARERFLREARTLSSLDHPNICRIYEYIEAEEGDFLVLELIDGVTLEKAIETGMSRARKMRIAVQICDALAVAHRKGIVHRDLKEENVMIAADGTVKVLDFGIARRGQEEEAAPQVPSSQDEPIEKAATLIFPVRGAHVTPHAQRPRPFTERGIAVGTPATMSPEQANGGTATPASDMYSLGLLLQTMFTEKPAHPPHLSSPELLLRAVAGTTEPMLGQPRPITALVERLERLAPADRPTAVETLEVLKRIVAAPARRARVATLIAMAIVLAAFAAKYVVDVTTARRQAEQRRIQAEELVSFMVGDLRTKLESVGRLDVLDGAASRALAYFASLDPDELSGENLHKNALALAQLGGVRIDEGKLDVAVKLFQESVRFAAAAVSRDPKRDEWQLALSNAHFWLGEALRQKGDHAGALRHFRNYLDISRTLAAAHPGDPKFAAEVSYGHGNVGAAHEAAGNLSGALAEYQTALDLDRRRLQSDAHNETWQKDLAVSLNRLGVVLQARADLAGARRAFSEELALQRQLVAAAPNDARRMHRLAVSYSYTGLLQQMMGDWHEALGSYRQELDLSTRLAALDSTNLNRRRNQLVAQLRLAGLMAGDPAGALRLAGQAENGLRTIVAKEPKPAWQRDLAVALHRKGTLSLENGNALGAREAAREAIAILEPLDAADPRNPQTIRPLCENLLLAARAEDANGSDELARQYRKRVIALTETQASDVRLTAIRARALIALGQRQQAEPEIARLRNSGYRDADLAPPPGAPPGSPPAP